MVNKQDVGHALARNESEPCSFRLFVCHTQLGSNERRARTAALGQVSLRREVDREKEPQPIEERSWRSAAFILEKSPEL